MDTEPKTADPEVKVWHAYIDESGDTGFTKYRVRGKRLRQGQRAGSSRTFLMAAVVVPPRDQANLGRKWVEITNDAGFRREGATHWVDAKHSQRIILASCMNKMPLTVLASVVLKPHLPEHEQLPKEALYLSTLEHLVSVIAEFAQEKLRLPVRLHIATWGSFGNDDYVALFAQMRDNPDSPVNWAFIDPTVESKAATESKLIQVADCAAGSIHAAFDLDYQGNSDPSYLAFIHNKIWRRKGAITPIGGGLRVHPASDEAKTAEHPWSDHIFQNRRWRK